LAAGGLPQAGVIYQEDFSNGLGIFSASGNVYTGSYGVRMCGGWGSDGTISSAPIDTTGFTA
jgi:hypothetical protein